MIINVEFGRVSAAFFDEDWNEHGAQWKIGDFERRFGLKFPSAKHITYDSYNNVFAVMGVDTNQGALKENIEKKVETIRSAILEREQKNAQEEEEEFQRATEKQQKREDALRAVEDSVLTILDREGLTKAKSDVESKVLVRRALAESK